MSTTANIRFMIRSDLDKVMGIEKHSKDPWTEDDFLRALREGNCVCIVAEIGERVVGFLVYFIRNKEIEVINVGVHPVCYRNGIGRLLIDRMKRKLEKKGRERITVHVHERNLAVQLWLKACGFRAVGIKRNYYPDDRDDAYQFRYSLTDAPVNTFATESNRIKKYI